MPLSNKQLNGSNFPPVAAGVMLKQAFQKWTSDPKTDRWRVMWCGGFHYPPWLQMPFIRKGWKQDLVFVGAAFEEPPQYTTVLQEGRPQTGVWCAEICYLHPSMGLRRIVIAAQLLEHFLECEMLVKEEMVSEGFDEVV